MVHVDSTLHEIPYHIWAEWSIARRTKEKKEAGTALTWQTRQVCGKYDDDKISITLYPD